MKPDVTPTPWFVVGDGYIEAGDGAGGVAITEGRASKADAKYIVLCVNSHEALLAACERALACLQEEVGLAVEDGPLIPQLQAAMALARPS